MGTGADLDKQRREVRSLSAKRRRLQGKEAGMGGSDSRKATARRVTVDAGGPASLPSTPRLTVSEVARTLLNRTPREMSHVGLTRNSRGDTQIEVKVYVGEDADAATVEAASLRCQAIYDDLVALYPPAEREAK